MKEFPGHQLLKERIAESLKLLINSANKAHGKRTAAPRHAHWVVTGVGSSEAHARFLVYLLHQYSMATAEYRPLSAFLDGPPPNCRHAGLIVFSQGLSPNATLALHYHRYFAHTVLFSAPIETFHKEEDAKRTDFLNALKESHAITFVPIGIDAERGELLRVIGPLHAYLAAIEWLKNTYPPGPKNIPQDAFEALINKAQETNFSLSSHEFIKSAREGGILVIGKAPLIEYAQNLAYKIMEGLLIPNVRIQEALSFAHGPFQAIKDAKNPPICILLECPEDSGFFRRVHEILGRTHALPLAIETEMPDIWRIFGYEITLNEWILKIAQQINLPLLNWPGKDEDGPLYDINLKMR